jgi:EAL domain-containing protein (putative c-di-GMP-specific phosphodiesterase class I)
MAWPFDKYSLDVTNVNHLALWYDVVRVKRVVFEVIERTLPNDAERLTLVVRELQKLDGFEVTHDGARYAWVYVDGLPAALCAIERTTI